MKTIPLSKGQVALVDDEDFEYLSQWKWCCSSHGYAVRRARVSEPNRGRIIYLHRVIAKAREDEEVDHRDLNTLNNLRSNLRVCNSSQNKMNRSCRKDSKLGIKGVQPHQGGFRARIKVNGKNLCLGVHETPEQASQAYAEAAATYFGQFARN